MGVHMCLDFAVDLIYFPKQQNFLGQREEVRDGGGMVN